MALRDPQFKADIDQIIDACTGVGELLDELTLLRASMRLYLDGLDPSDAVAQASEMLSDSLTKRSRP